MTNGHIAKSAIEYRAIKIVLQGIAGDNEDAPDFLHDRASRLVRRLVDAGAVTGEDLAHKASVLLDWIAGDDLPSQLALSLCRDTVQAFPVSTDWPEQKGPRQLGANVP